MAKGFIFFTNAIDKTPATTGSWQNVNVSGDIPAGSSGVILELVNTGSTAYQAAVRKNGSGDDRSAYSDILGDGHCYALCGVDENRIFQAFIEHANIKIYLVGYCDDCVVFELNAIDKSITTTGAFTDIDISASAPADATGVIVEMVDTSTTVYKGDVRKNGSGDNQTSNSKIVGSGHVYALCGIDDAKIFEHYIDNAAVDLYIVGYTKAPIVWLLNIVSKALGSTGWSDIDITGDTTIKTVGSIFRIINTSSISSYAGSVRKKGSTDDRSADNKMRANGHMWALTGTDEEQVLEGYIANTAVDHYLTGYVEETFKKYSADILLQKQGDTKAYSSDLLIQKKGDTKTYSADMQIVHYRIQGVTKDSGGNPLGNCTVDLFRTSDDVKEQTLTSDANGNYVFKCQKNVEYYMRAFKSGTPDVFGTTDDVTPEKLVD